MSAGRAILGLAFVLAALALLPAAASADQFAGIELTSARAAGGGLPYVQATEAADPVISANGRYMAFAGTFSGATGVWRRDLQTGALEQVAPGAANLPSISADGRYVSFTTNERLVPADSNPSPDVYVRDMEAPCMSATLCEPCAEEQACPFTLASAVDGSSEGASYGASPADSLYAHAAEVFGAIAGRSAISADGREVAFETTAASDLLGGGSESTPPLEILLRRLDSDETVLVSSTYDAEAGQDSGTPVPLSGSPSEGASEFGAVFPGGASTPPFASSALSPAGTMKWLGPSLSADGTTVAWLGEQVAQQASMLPFEAASNRPQYAEPLWRRIADGPTTPTRRVTGGSDPASPTCVGSGEQRLENENDPLPSDPCAGPFGVNTLFGLWSASIDADPVPQLSADGTRVAFLTNAHAVADGPVPFAAEESFDDLYVADMSSPLTRVRALQRVTRKEGTSSDQTEALEKASVINDFALSADGSQVAFTTQRTAFGVGPFSYVSTPPPLPGMSELFDADLANGTLTRVTRGFGGEDEPSEQPHGEISPGQDPYGPHQGAFAPTFTADGSELGFSSTAANLIYGDGNGAPDAFVAHRVTFPSAPVLQSVSPPPPNPRPVPEWRVGATARSRADGSVVLYVSVPGPGRVSAAARVRLRIVHAGRGSSPIVARTVATAHAGVASPPEGIVAVRLVLARPYRSLVSRTHGLPATVTVTFSAAGRPTRRFALTVVFRRSAKAARRAALRGAR